MRSMFSVVMPDQSYPEKKGEFIRTPSTSTSVCVELVPRVKSDVSEPGFPYCATSRPGTERSTSETTADSCLSSSFLVITVIAEPTSFSSSGTDVAVTTTLSEAGGGCWARANGVTSSSAKPAAATPRTNFGGWGISRDRAPRNTSRTAVVIRTSRSIRRRSRAVRKGSRAARKWEVASSLVWPRPRSVSSGRSPGFRILRLRAPSQKRDRPSDLSLPVDCRPRRPR